MRRVLKRLQVPLPYKLGFNAIDNPYSSKGFFKLCEDYGAPHDLMRYQNNKFFGTHQHGSWSDYIGADSVTRWIIKKSQGYTDVGLFSHIREH